MFRGSFGFHCKDNAGKKFSISHINSETKTGGRCTGASTDYADVILAHTILQPLSHRKRAMIMMIKRLRSSGRVQYEAFPNRRKLTSLCLDSFLIVEPHEQKLDELLRHQQVASCSKLLPSQFNALSSQWCSYVNVAISELGMPKHFQTHTYNPSKPEEYGWESSDQPDEYQDGAVLITKQTMQMSQNPCEPRRVD